MIFFSFFIILLFLQIIVLWIPVVEAEYEYYERKFQENSERTCRKYEFIQRYEEIMKHPKDRFFIFVYHENGYSNGGLGDRIAGLITAVAYAIRFKRVLLIEGDPAFGKLFKSYHFANTSDNGHTWGNWSWSGWKDSYGLEMQTMHCVNPKPRKTECALDRDSPSRIVKLFGNRAYLCRWLVKENLQLKEELYEQLQIDLQTNLYEVAGCLLRLALYPTHQLWKSLVHLRRSSLRRQSNHHSNFESIHTNHTMRHSRGIHHHHHHHPVDFQVGIHFRCGDSSFRQKNQAPNPRCVVLPNVTWQGTLFGDDYSMDSPIDLAHCAQRTLNTYANNTSSSRTAVFIASDNADSSKQISSHLASHTTILQPFGSCHVDLKSDEDCAASTIVEWFALSLSDVILTQSTLKIDRQTVYGDSSENDYLLKPYREEFGPISSFSRYAIVYGLSSHRLLDSQCTSVNTTTLAHSTRGNWVCTPRTFF